MNIKWNKKHFPCFKDWPNVQTNRAYSIISLLLQYIIPVIVVFYAYTQVYKKFQESTANAMRVTDDNPSNKVIRNIRRRRRTNVLLVLMSVVFFLSWAPLNIVSVSLKFIESDILVITSCY